MKKLKFSSRLIIVILFLLGLLLLFFSQINIPKCLGVFLSAIGQTFIGSSVVSFFLTLEDVQTLFLGIVKEIMVDNNNAKLFSSQQLEKMHFMCHKNLHFHNMRFDEKDWINLSDKCVETFTSPYYKNWKENIECNLQKDIIEKNIVLDFELINPMIDGEITANISRSYSLDIPDGRVKEDFVNVISLSIKRDDEQLKCTPFVEFSQNDNNVYKTKACIKCKEYDLENISFKKRLIVNMKHTTKVLKDDKSYTHRLRYAARRYLLDFTCNDKRVSIYPNFFGGFIGLNDFDRHNGGSHILIECKDRLILPGSGASIVLNFNEKGNKYDTRRELLKTK